MELVEGLSVARGGERGEAACELVSAQNGVGAHGEHDGVGPVAQLGGAAVVAFQPGEQRGRNEPAGFPERLVHFACQPGGFVGCGDGGGPVEELQGCPGVLCEYFEEQGDVASAA